MRKIPARTACDWAVAIWVILTLANFLVFALIALHLGGTAVSGRVSDGHFFLGSHSRYTEVSRQVFIYSRWHCYSVFITFAVSFAAAFGLQRRGRDGKRQTPGA